MHVIFVISSRAFTYPRLAAPTLLNLFDCLQSYTVAQQQQNKALNPTPSASATAATAASAHSSFIANQKFPSSHQVRGEEGGERDKFSTQIHVAPFFRSREESRSSGKRRNRRAAAGKKSRAGKSRAIITSPRRRSRVSFHAGN